MKYLIILYFLISVLKSYSQPQSFSWHSEEDSLRYNYISSAKDQGEQSPCHIFAAVGAVEAMSHIYFNKPFHFNPDSGINLAEREIYLGCSDYRRFLAAVSAKDKPIKRK